MHAMHLMASGVPCKTGTFNTSFTLQASPAVSVVAGANPYRWGFVLGTFPPGGYMTINFGNIQAINVNGEVAILNNQPVVFFTHERIGSAIHEEITAISNAGGANVTCFEVTLLDFECPFCYPKAALKRKALIEKYDADLAAGSLVKENYGYNNTYARYSY